MARRVLSVMNSGCLRISLQFRIILSMSMRHSSTSTITSILLFSIVCAVSCGLRFYHFYNTVATIKCKGVKDLTDCIFYKPHKPIHNRPLVGWRH